MRVITAALLITSTMAAAAQGTTTKKPAAATHRPTARVPRMPMPAASQTDPKADEGLAAAGTMPAATGPSAPLYTLRYVDLKIGEGELARASAPGAIVFYTVHYTGWLTDGTKFDSSVDRNQPFVFPAGAKRVIAAWDTGFEGMRVGGKRRLIVPYQLAYGAAGSPPVIPARADLIFDVELLGQGDTPQPVTVATPTTAEAGTAVTKKQAERPEEHQE